MSVLGSIPKELKSTTWVFPGEIRKPHSMAHSSIASKIICMILIISSTFFPDFQTALSSANCERSTPYLISRLCNFCLSESPITLKSVGLSTAPWGDPFSCSWKSAHSSSIFTRIFLSVKKSLIHFNVRPLMPYSVSLSITPDQKFFLNPRIQLKLFVSLTLMCG